MDAAQNLTGRRFPAYTLTELKNRVSDGAASPELLSAMVDEINRRESGQSKVYKVPQIQAFRIDGAA